VKTVEWHETESGPQVWLIDQVRLPHEEIAVRCGDYLQVAQAIRTMQVRGAPAIGVTAAMGVAIGAHYGPEDAGAFESHLDVVADVLARTRPTAVNLFWGISRLRRLAQTLALAGRSVPEIKAALVAEAQAVAAEDEAGSRRIGEHGAALFAAGDGVLTHCNAGALACVDYGTALAPLRFAHQQGKGLHRDHGQHGGLLHGARRGAESHRRRRPHRR
jgi:methylthioribose-1-phosphate isomerase